MDHFSSLRNNWIASILSSSEYSPIPTDSRFPKPSGEDSYFGHALASSSTIPHVLTLRRRELTPPPSPEATSTSTSTTTGSGTGTRSGAGGGAPLWPAPTAKPSSAPLVNPSDVIMLVDLSAPGICGHPDTVHGGVIATLLDEVMSLAVSIHSGQIGGSGTGGVGNENENPRGKIFTAQLDVRYKKPLLAPAVAVVKSRVIARQGRKFWVRAQVVQEEKNEQADKHLEWPKRKVVTTDAMAFWLQTKSNL